MKLLFVNACIRRDKSRTLFLAKKYLERYKDWDVKELDLEEMYAEGVLKIQDSAELALRDELISMGDFDNSVFDLARDFLSADFVVISAPYWDLQFPALLKVYLERISVTGLTFTYDAAGAIHGAAKAKRACYITTAGGYTAGMNYGYDYIRGLFTKLFGFEDVELIMAEGLDIVGNDTEKILDSVVL